MRKKFLEKLSNFGWFWKIYDINDAIKGKYKSLPLDCIPRGDFAGQEFSNPPNDPKTIKNVKFFYLNAKQ